eukprot:CAMPEP_0172455404 /NCGR_PEP_ID=MMETSP1065-20121228/12050_1 /TAXON_ID=265537 /ORGANISM="Amphiprora paludosa, Strain CCMP125" /LENGTH=581 /DNA_ID=CAMNT_0013207865 /DNA_START=274 /DNA_END=2019 /DNA_ORIENTATION=-
MASLKSTATDYAHQFGLDPATEGAFYALFSAIQKLDFVRQQKPFVLRHEQVQQLAWGNDPVNWPGFFAMEPDLAKALEDDFLDAARGSTDNRKGWQITDVSVPRGESFEEARMTFDDVQSALDKGTVIFNAAGAHISKLAGPTLACTDATWLPCALNLYITAAGKRTSAPPHTDKQDVVVIQSTGSKHWKVYSPPNPADKPQAEMFARGKMEDSLPLYLMESDLGCELLLETSLYPGDVLFIPAAFPHTTSTIPNADNDHPATDDTSLHMTMGLDHHIWELDYLSVRRLALRRAGVADTALGRMMDDENAYTGACNELPANVRKDLFAELPLGFLNEEMDDTAKSAMMDTVTQEVKRISHAVDEATASQVPDSIWRETVERVRQQGVELLDVHRDMYLAALEEGRVREQEEAMTAHLHKDSDATNPAPKVIMSPERVQRLSLFRVKGFFDTIDQSKKQLREWSYGDQTAAGGVATPAQGGDAASTADLPADWAFTMPVKVGDQVEADLGGAFFPATVTRAVNNKIFDVEYFDGDRDTNMERSQIKLLKPPKVTAEKDEVDTSGMTPKQLKRWKKQQEKLNK